MPISCQNSPPAAGAYGNWDRFGRTLKQRWFHSSTTLDQFEYAYDYAGNRLTRDTDGTTTYDQDYTYDGLQRLKTVDEPTASKDRYWLLDQLGNWEKLYEGLDGSGTLLENRLTLIDNAINGWTVGSFATPAYDKAGNMTTMPRPYDTSKSFDVKYDAWNRMVSVAPFVMNPVAFQVNEYDGNHHRIRKIIDGGGTVDYYYNHQWQVIVEAVNGSADSLYAWHNYYIDALAVRFTKFSKHVFLHDANFNVTAAYDITSGSGTYRQVVERYAYTPYGEVTILDANFSVDADQVSDIDNYHLYTGRERDPETGLQLNRRRWYHAALGRWVSWDPIGYWDGRNLYEYVSSDPVVATDPLGLRRFVVTICVSDNDRPNNFDRECIEKAMQEILSNAGITDISIVISDCEHKPNELGWQYDMYTYFGHSRLTWLNPGAYVIYPWHDFYTLAARTPLAYNHNCRFDPREGGALPIAYTPQRRTTIYTFKLRSEMERLGKLDPCVVYANILFHEVFYLQIIGSGDAELNIFQKEVTEASSREGKSRGLLCLTDEEIEDLCDETGAQHK